MKFLDIFAGIGGFRLGLERAGHECVGHVEIDKFANRSYDAIYRPGKEEFFHNDITKLTDEHVRQLKELRIDLITGGFPCQAFSIAGKRAGFEDTRGTLFFDIARMARVIRPSYLFLENVTGLLSHEGGDTFETILRTLDELGYDTEWQVLNSKDFGVPQNREREFIVGHLRPWGGTRVFPIQERTKEVDEIELQERPGANIAPIFTVSMPESTRRDIASRYAFRDLTPKEYFRLQGFPDWAFDRAKAAGVSDSQLYKQAGNAVTVNVIESIAKKLRIEEV